MQEQENQGKFRRSRPPAISTDTLQCDSKHPRCTACATAGTVCHQEDRHRQTLTPRGHTERIEHLLAQCTALLKHHIPGFSVDTIDDCLLREGIDTAQIAPPQPTASFQTDQAKAPLQHPKGYPLYPPPPHLVHAPYPPGLMPYGPHPGPYHPQIPIQGPYTTHLLPAFQPPGAPYPPPPVHAPPQPVPRGHTKGQDPNGNDLSNTDVSFFPSLPTPILIITQSLAKNFGVHAAIVSEIPPPIHDKEDLAVGSNGLSSGRDQPNGSAPRESQHWITVQARSSSYGPETTLIWLPKDRDTVQRIVEAYFERLNPHRPVYSRQSLEKIVNDLYEGVTSLYDPGHLCSLYIILALGTLSEINRQAMSEDHIGKESVHSLSLAAAKKWMPLNWPDHEEFFERALAIKPSLRVTISSLQALILLHWYLYTEVRRSKNMQCNHSDSLP